MHIYKNPTPLELNIFNFADSLFSYLVDEIPTTITTKTSHSQYSDIIFEIHIGKIYSFKFLRKWGERKFYIILYKGGKYIWELFLPRILFHKNNTITWYLSTPKHNSIINAYSKYLEATNIDIKIARQIKYQQDILHDRKNFRIVNDGYIIANNQDAYFAFSKIRNILLDITGITPTCGDHFGFNEGKKQSSTHSKRTRNTNYIPIVRERDNYTCQACGLKLFINERYVLHVHHIERLKGEQTTLLDDLVCLCPNCHFIAHTHDPPLNSTEIRELLTKNRQCG